MSDDPPKALSPGDKRTEFVSARVSWDLLRAIEAIAAARGVSRSDLICTLLLAFVEKERAAWERLSVAFGHPRGISDAREESDGDDPSG